MRVVIAPDSFKECLSATKVAEFIAMGVSRACPEAEIIAVPVADGGEGTVDAIIKATQGKRIPVQSVDALMRPISSFFGVSGDGKTAIIEIAAASGIELLSPEDRNPLFTTTYGAGLLLKNALELGFKNIIIGLGGSATNDGGVGFAEALGYRFTDNDGNLLKKGGGHLNQLKGIDVSEINPLLNDATITVACDVNNTLCGVKGASFVFGPQKGATEKMVIELDANLKHFAAVVRTQLRKEIEHIPGGGAAGGLGAGLLAFTNAKLQPGFEIIKDITGLDEKIRTADLVFTAEGKIDIQTQYGKTPSGIGEIALKYNTPVVALAGLIGDGSEVLLEKGINKILSISSKPISIKESIENAGILLTERSYKVMCAFLNKGIDGVNKLS